MCGIDVNSSLSIWCNSPVKLFGPGNLFCGCSLNYKFNFLTWCCSNYLFHIEWVVVQFSSVAQSCLFATPWTAARQASLTITNSQSLLKLMSIESVMPSSHLILYGPLLLPPSIFPSIRVFSKESPFRIRWPKYWSFSFNISLPNEYSGLISLGWTSWISLQSKGLSRVFSNTTVQKHQFFGAQPSSQSNSNIHAWLLEKP